MQEFIDTLKLRGLSPKTISAYTYHAGKFLKQTGKTRLNTTNKDIKDYLISLINNGYCSNTIRIIQAALISYFPNIKIEDLPKPKKHKPLPKVLSKQEIKGMIAATTNLKHRLIIKILYSTGIRVSELVNLKKQDINTERNTVLVNSGKGNKDRITLLSTGIKEELLKYALQNHEEYLFQGRGKRYPVKTIQKILDTARKKAGITKKVTPHMMRHSFATHLLEQGTDIRYIQRLLGHEQLTTTQIYTKVSNAEISKIKNPLDEL
ncbi:MAG: site-specific tyrosine recombinase/integron integrase [archaeon]